MDDFKSVTVSHLRELARKHLGPGHSKLNKKELVAALARFVPALKRLARLAGIELPGGEKPAPKAAAKSAQGGEKQAPERKKEPRGKKEPVKKASSPLAPKHPAPPPASATPEAPSPRPAHVVNFPPRSRSSQEPFPEEGSQQATPEPAAAAQHPAEPLVEGFFVARVMGERELRRHHLTEEQSPRPVVNGGTASPGYEENLGELPLDYGNDLALALARDPHTLFITWDFSPGLLARASQGLEAPRAVLRVFDAGSQVREEEIALESRSFYIHGLVPGRPYRVEVHFVGRDGRSRRIGSSTHLLTLPRVGVSPDTSVRFIRVPPPQPPGAQGVPPAGVRAGGLPGEQPLPEEQVEYIEEREYIQWRRVPLPGSDEHLESSESRRARAARGKRGEGRPPGPIEHLEISARPPGSSEQSAGRGEPGKEGASGQAYWTPPPSGRGR